MDGPSTGGGDVASFNDRACQRRQVMSIVLFLVVI